MKEISLYAAPFDIAMGHTVSSIYVDSILVFLLVYCLLLSTLENKIARNYLICSLFL